MLEVSTQKYNAFGLDISDLSLKIAKLERKGGLKLVSFGGVDIPPKMIEGGEVKDEKTLSEIIKKCLAGVKGKKIKTKNVILSLPEEKSFLDILQIPSVKKEDLEGTVRFEAGNHIPIALEETYFDFEEILSDSKDKKYIEVLVAAVPKNIVDSYSNSLRMANLKPLVLEVESLAITRALIEKGISSLPLLIIDFGQTRTSFIIFAGKNLRFTSTIPISSQSLTESIARSLKIDLKEAERLKLKYGLEDKKELFEAMVPPLTDLIEQIRTHLDYYHSHIPQDRINADGKELEKILLCGGGANLKGFVEFLTSQLRIPVQFGNPWVNILRKPLKEIPELPFEQSLAYTTALGLALRGIKDFV